LLVQGVGERTNEVSERGPIVCSDVLEVQVEAVVTLVDGVRHDLLDGMRGRFVDREQLMVER